MADKSTNCKQAHARGAEAASLSLLVRLARGVYRPVMLITAAAVALGGLFLVQTLALVGVIAGSIPGGSRLAAQGGGLLETGATLVLPGLAWAWAVFGGGADVRRGGRHP